MNHPRKMQQRLFRCQTCGTEQDAPKVRGRTPPGHIKTMWCYMCQLRTNHIQVDENQKGAQMDGLQIFNSSEFGQIRTAEENGNVLFCGSDVAKALGYSNPTKTLGDHCKAAIDRRTNDSLGRLQVMKFIPEPDLYRLIANSKLPAAERFEKWVFEQVLPSIRKHGGYVTGQESMSNEELLSRAILAANSIIDEKNKAITAMTPKALFADAVAASKTAILVGELAKLLKQNGVETGQNRLFEDLRRDGYLVRRNGADYNMPTQYSMELGLFEIKETTVSHADGHITVQKTPKVTGKGQQYFINKYVA